MILFKYPEKQRELARVHPRVRSLLDWVANYCWQNWQEDVIVTDIFRDDPTSTHYYGRAIDLALLSRASSEDLRTLINDLFPYGGKHETVPPLDHGTAPHIHLQVQGEPYHKEV